MSYFRPDAPLDRWCADLDVEVFGLSDLALPALPMRPTERVPLDSRADAIARLASRLMWDDGLGARRAPRWSAFDEEAFIAEVVTNYHDYPYGALIDAIDARGCA